MPGNHSANSFNMTAPDDKDERSEFLPAISTMRLRFVERRREPGWTIRVLQQLWISTHFVHDLVHEEWRDVPTVGEEVSKATVAPAPTSGQESVALSDAVRMGLEYWEEREAEIRAGSATITTEDEVLEAFGYAYSAGFRAATASPTQPINMRLLDALRSMVEAQELDLTPITPYRLKEALSAIKEAEAATQESKP